MNKIGGYDVEKLREGIYALDEGGVRIFAFTGGERPLIIDSGYGKGDLKTALNEVAPEIGEMLLTHTDRDHMGGASLFSKVYMHPDEEEHFGSFDGSISYVNDGDIINAGMYKLRVIHLPGHTPGSIALLCEEHGFLISGDSVSIAPIFMFGEGRDLPEYIKSLEKLASLRDSFGVIYPSHGPLPLETDILDDLIEGAKLLLNNELTPFDPPMPLPCKVYSHKRAKFLK